MLLRPAFIVLSIMLFCGCALPKQPPLNANEKLFIGQLQENCQCEIVREVNPDVKKNGGESGAYFLMFKKMPCSALDERNELKSNSDKIAADLLQHVLNDSFKYRYDKIWLAYECDSNSCDYIYIVRNKQIIEVRYWNQNLYTETKP